MSVYVDEAIWEWRGKVWCHLTADTLEELHAFAVDQLGLRRSWFQHKDGQDWKDHYDLTEGKRAQAIALGAVQLDFHAAGERLNARLGQREAPTTVSTMTAYKPQTGQRLIDVDGHQVLLFGRKGCPMSNFAAAAMSWPCPHCGQQLQVGTVEHAFQAAKTTTCHEAHRVAGAAGPSDARALGRRVQLRPDWEASTGTVAGQRVSFKAEVMWGLLRTKFATLEYSATLEDTGELVLVEDAPWDGFWGAGEDGRGKNVLGRLLMTLRQELRGEVATIAPPTPAIPR